MRIISGYLKKKKITPVPGMETRPTSDRLRETLFNILSGKIRDASVLDLFAGTGALGIEALSRGAASCVFIDNQRRAVSVIKKNIDACSLNQLSTVYTWDVTRNLNCIKNKTPLFNLVFMDPPYNRNMITPTLNNLHTSQCLAKNAMLVIEHGHSEIIDLPTGIYQLTDHRIYGKTAVSFLTYSMD